MNKISETEKSVMRIYSYKCSWKEGKVTDVTMRIRVFKNTLRNCMD